MDSTKRKALQAAGCMVGDAADFPGLTDEERRLLDPPVEECRRNSSVHRPPMCTILDGGGDCGTRPDVPPE